MSLLSLLEAPEGGEGPWTASPALSRVWDTAVAIAADKKSMLSTEVSPQNSSCDAYPLLHVCLLCGVQHVLLALVQDTGASARGWVTVLGLSADSVVAKLTAKVATATSEAVALSPNLAVAALTAQQLVRWAGVGTELTSEVMFVSLLLSTADGTVAGAVLEDAAREAGVDLNPLVLLQSLLPKGVSARAFCVQKHLLVTKLRSKRMEWFTTVIAADPAAGEAAAAASAGPWSRKDASDADSGAGSGAGSGPGAAAAAAVPAAAVEVPAAGADASAGAGAGAGAAVGPAVGLPELPDPDTAGASMQGPVRGTNWLVPGLVACGPRPDSYDMVAKLLEAGISTIVSLE